MNIMNTSQNLLFAVLPKSVEQLSKQLHSKIIDPIILQKLVERKSFTSCLVKNCWFIIISMISIYSICILLEG